MIRTSIRIVALGAALAVLAGCSGVTTYGTGVDPGTQTLRDVTGLVELRPDDEEKIEYEERAGIVAPPSPALPPPADNTAQVASNFPVDPEDRRRELQRRADEAERPGELIAYEPALRTNRRPNEASTGIACDESDPVCMSRKVAAAKGSLKPRDTSQQVDQYGVPVRKYLVEPPSEYRQPSPDAPVEVVERKEDRGFLSRLWPF